MIRQVQKEGPNRTSPDHLQGTQISTIHIYQLSKATKLNISKVCEATYKRSLVHCNQKIYDREGFDSDKDVQLALYNLKL